MKRLFFCLFFVLLAIPAHAESLGRVREDGPELHVTVTAAAPFDDSAEYPWTLEAALTAEDGSLDQRLRWQSHVSAEHDGVAALIRLVDYNFDGCLDLQLLVGAGARNVTFAFALWNEAEGRFDPVMTGGNRLPGGQKREGVHQLVVCNPVFDAERRTIHSDLQDGWYYRTEELIYWESPRSQYQQVVVSVYDAGKGLIGESVDVWGTGLLRLWDQVYPASWYYGDDGEGASRHRRAAIDRIIADGGLPDLSVMQVAHVDWVHLRERDSKASASLARLDRGADVTVLQTGCGADGGWVLVWCANGDLGLPVGEAALQDTLVDGMTGYIWHSYLEPWRLTVAHTDWVNMREAPDKASPSIAQLDAGTIVYRCGAGRQEVEGWVPVVVMFADGQSFTGYIWHSFLEEAK